MTQLSKSIFSIAVLSYVVYTLFSGLNQSFGTENTMMVVNSLMVLTCTGLLIRLYQKFQLLTRTFSGVSVQNSEKKDFNINLSEKVQPLWAFIPSLIFGNRSYKRDEIIAAYVFISFIILGFIFLVKIIAGQAWN